MSDDIINGKPTTTFWTVGGGALIWNLFGLFTYVQTRMATAEAYAAAGYSPEQIAFIQAVPEWAMSAYAIAVTAGVLASLFLLLRKVWAVHAFVLSLVAVIVVNINNFVLTDTVAVLGMVPVYIQSTVVVAGILLLLYARAARARGWLH